MAGDDPGGRDWAAAYDRGAAAALRAGQDAINACYKVSSMFAQTARNYEAADAASTPGVRHAIAAATATLPDDCVVGLAFDVPTAAGGSGSAPTGWGLIQHVVGYVWPDGHQDRLHAAASSWRSCADSLWSLSEYAAVAAVPAMGHHLPEFADMSTVCNGVYMHLREVAHAQYGLADACVELAHHLDVVHSEVEGELVSLVEWSAAIQATGFLASVFSFGTAEGPTQAAQAGRIARTAARVAQLIEKFIAMARAVASSIAAVTGRAEAVAARLRVVLSAKVTTAAVTAAGRLRSVRATGELGALGRLAVDRDIAFRYIDNPKLFDPAVLRGRTIEDVRSAIPKEWARKPSRRGNGEVFRDPANSGRQIRIMAGYPAGSRADPVTLGPYAVVSQGGKSPVKIALAGNPTLK